MSKDKKAIIALGACTLLVLCMPLFFMSVKPKTDAYIVAVPIETPSLNSPLSRAFARCRYFALCNLKNGDIEYIPNRFALKTHQVGMLVTHQLLRKNVGSVLAPVIGPEPYEHLRDRGVEVYAAGTGNLQEVLRRFRANVMPEGSSRQNMTPTNAPLDAPSPGQDPIPMVSGFAMLTPFPAESEMSSIFNRQGNGKHGFSPIVVSL